MRQRSKHHPELFWPGVVVRKWLNISTKDSDYSADSDDEDDDVDFNSDIEEFDQGGKGSRLRNCCHNDTHVDPIGDVLTAEKCQIVVEMNDDTLPRVRRRKSETFRAQYINTKEIKIHVGTWNVGGKLPPDDLDIDEWLNVSEPADIYVLGLQEIVPLNAGNIFGAEDNRPVPKWENIIRETLNRARPTKAKVKCYSDPPSPSRFKPSEDIPDIEEEFLLETDSDGDEEVHPIDDESDGFGEGRPHTDRDAFTTFLGADYADSGKFSELDGEELERQFSSPKRLDRLNCLRTEEQIEVPFAQHNTRLTRMLSSSERMGLSWPEPPLNLISQGVLERPNSFKSTRSFQAAKSFRTFNSFKSFRNEAPLDLSLLAELDIESILKRKRRTPFVRIVSKQMVGIFLTIWVRRSLRRHIQNLKVSTVGVGIMGYIGNKGSVSVSMSIYQTLFCFICTHLTSGEKDGDELKRNADVLEIRRRTHFRSVSGIRLPKSIIDHEKIIWLGDLNYRINLSYEKTRELVSKKEWSKLTERDQLVRELRKGRTFDGWSEGTLDFPPTYKYENNSEKYFGEDPKFGRRTPAWCDRILSYGRGMRQLCYRRAEIRFSDHRPVTATYMAEVEVFSSKKLQRALILTDAEIDEEFAANMGFDA